MPVYAYKGFNVAGKQVGGTRDAENPRAMKQQLKRDGIYVTELSETTAQKESAPRRVPFAGLVQPRVTPEGLAAATRQLATLVGAGIPLVDALVALIDQIEQPYFKAVLADVRQRVTEGAGFGDALANHPRVFGNLYVNLVRAGESSGALEIVLSRLADFTESQAELRGKLIGSMVYPVLMMFMAMGVTSFLFIVVIPRIARIFESQKVALPLPTQLVMVVSSLLRDYGLMLVPLIALSVWLAVRYFKSPRGRPAWDRFVLRVPIFGPLVRMVAVTRFAKTLSTLLSSGVPLLTAFEIVKNVVQNSVLVGVIDVAAAAVKEGESIAAPLKRSGEFPPIVTHMIAIGEKSGQLEQMLANIARSYEVQVDARLRAMTSLLEPLMIVVMGVVVGFIVLSILLPMLQLASFA